MPKNNRRNIQKQVSDTVQTTEKPDHSQALENQMSEQSDAQRVVKGTPITGTRHILYQYEPFKAEDKEIPMFDFLHKNGKMEFYRDDEKLPTNKEHYYPTFIV